MFTVSEKKIKRAFLFVNLTCFILTLSGCIYNGYTETTTETEITSEEETSKNIDPTEEPKKNTPQNIGENLPITRGLAAKMIALTFGTVSEINNTERTIQYSDTSPEDKFDKYINYVCTKKYINETGEKFMPEEYLTVSQAQKIIDQIDAAHKIKINITDEIKDKPISYNLWTEIYTEVLKNLAGNTSIKEKFGISAEKSVILAVPRNNKYIKDGFAITDKGLLKCDGFDLTPYIEKEISFWTKENELFALADITSETPTIKNVFVTENKGDTFTIFTGGAEKNYKKSENLVTGENENRIADITLNDKKEITSIDYISEEKEKQIKSITDTALTCVDDETFELSPDYKVYYIQDNKTMLGSKEDILEGKTYSLCLKDNKVCAFIFRKFKGNTD